MTPRAIEELIKIMGIEGTDKLNGTNARLLALQEWQDEWIEEVNYEQAVIKKQLTSEDLDFVKYYLAYQLGDRLMDYCVHVDESGNRIKTKVYAFKR